MREVIAFAFVDKNNHKLVSRECDSDVEDGRYYIYETFAEANEGLKNSGLEGYVIEEVTILVKED